MREWREFHQKELFVEKILLINKILREERTKICFSCIKKMISGKHTARERELATFDDYRRAVGMLNPVRDKK